MMMKLPDVIWVTLCIYTPKYNSLWCLVYGGFLTLTHPHLHYYWHFPTMVGFCHGGTMLGTHDDDDDDDHLSSHKNSGPHSPFDPSRPHTISYTPFILNSTPEPGIQDIFSNMVMMHRVCIFFMKFKTLSTAHCCKAVECAPDCVSPNAPSCTSEKNTKLRQIQGIEHSSSNSLPLPNDFARKSDNILPIN